MRDKETKYLRRLAGRPDRRGFLRHFRDRLESWGVDKEGHLAVRLKSSSFDMLSIKVKTVFWGEHEVTFIARKTFMPKEEMTEREKGAYAELKRAEFEINWKGLLRRKYFCSNSSSLKALSRALKSDGRAELRHDPRLCEMVLSNDGIGKILRELRPERVQAYLHSGYVPPGTPEKEAIAEMLDFYEDPEELRWEISVTKLVSVATISPHDVRLMVDLLERMMQKLLAHTRDSLTRAP